MAEQLIKAYLDDTAGAPFVWGQTDCACWTAGLVRAATGHDPAAGFRGTYDSWASARQVWMARGGLLAMARAGMADFAAGEARTGVAVIRLGRHTLCGVLLRGVAAVKRQGRGLILTRQFDLVEGWTLWQPH